MFCQFVPLSFKTLIRVLRCVAPVLGPRARVGSFKYVIASPFAMMALNPRIGFKTVHACSPFVRITRNGRDLVVDLDTCRVVGGSLDLACSTSRN